MKKLQEIFFLLSLFCLNCFVYSQNNLTMENMRIQVWSLLENEPGAHLGVVDSKPEDKFYTNSIREIKKLAPYIFEGMIFGFDFSYTPYDKTRQVQEYFESSFNRQSYVDNKDFTKLISYQDPYFQDNKLICWAEFDLSQGLGQMLYRKSSISMHVTSGKGCGKLSEGIEGIQTALEESMKLAIRSYAQNITKNKPKEISGTVLIQREPRIYIKNNQYFIECTFLIENMKITNYTVF